MKKNIFINTPNKRMILFLVLIVSILVFGSYINIKTKDNKLYEINEDKNEEQIKKIDGQIQTSGENHFLKGNFEISDNEFPITISNDNQYIFYFKANNKTKNNKIIMGEAPLMGDLLMYNIKLRKSTILKKDIPLITISKWNSQNNIVAFCGGEKIYVYSILNKEFLFEDETKGDNVTYFGWSPDGNKLYTEHGNLINNTIYYIDSKEKIESYNCNENRYYKGRLSKGYYYVTINEFISQNMQKSSTLIVDSRGRKIKKIYDGKYRDSLKLSTLLIGENNFDLYYIKNINNLNNVKTISTKYIYDAKFLYDGSFAYTVKSDNINKNDFTMIIVDKNGDKVKDINVSGGKFLLLPNGRQALISGRNNEIVDFKKRTIKILNKNCDNEFNNIFTTIRGAGEVIAKYICTGNYNLDETKKYFMDDKKHSKYALFDIENIYKDKNEIIPTVFSNQFNLKIAINNLNFTDKNHLYTNVSANITNSSGSNNNINIEIEMAYNKLQEKWYITGFGNFSYTNEYSKVESISKDLIQKAMQGRVFNGKFKNKQIQLLQIQFWDISKLAPASDINKSTYCKLYVSISDSGQNSVYKIILHKNLKGCWEVLEYSKENLSKLY